MKTSLNHSYRLVWSDVQQTFVPVPECASGRGKSSGGKASRITRTLLASFALTAGVAHAQALLPTGGQVVGGSGSIATQDKSMTVTQTSDRMAANWQSFSIGKDHSVNFVQPSSSAVALNRVLGSDVSVIQGAINANGQVFLVNPNGVLFTKDAQVNVGAMVASTLNISAADFMAGNYKFEGASSNAIVNQGRITAHGDGTGGGAVALIAAKITNEGSIAAHAGNVLMGSGSKVTLDLGGPVKIQVEQGALDALITQGGAIKADGGLVYLSAKAAGDLVSTVINHTGVTEAQTLATGETGQIYLMGGMQKDRIEVGGALKAEGGFIETSSAKVKVEDAVKVRAGEWLIDPYDFTIAASGGDISGTAVSNALAAGNVTIKTADSSVSCTGLTGCGSGSSSGNGDIFVNDRITWTSGNMLTLNAYRNIEINAPMDASGGLGGKLVLYYGQGAGTDGNTATYTINAPVKLQNGLNFITQFGFDGQAILYTVVNSQADLQSMSLAGNYALGSSLSFTGNWAPIGSRWDSCTTMFCGNFDGLGNTISNMSIGGRDGFDSYGLFGAVKNATVQNLTLNNASVDVDGATNIPGNTVYVGTLIGLSEDSSIRNVKVLGGSVRVPESINTSYTGGLAGYLYGGAFVGASRLTDSSAAASVTGKDYVGGLLGYSNWGLIARSAAGGSVIGSGNFVGGLAGFNDGAIEDTYATGPVSGAADAGGLTGKNTGTIARVWASGHVDAASNEGGLVGNNDGTVTQSFWDINTTGQTAGVGTGSAVGMNPLGTGIAGGSSGLYDRSPYGLGDDVEGVHTYGTFDGTNWIGFDFANTWWMVDGATRPFLRSEWRPAITNAHELQLMGSKPSAAYALANNIDLASSLTKQSEMWKGTLDGASFQGNWSPIGNSTTKFSGAFDGQNHSISGLFINSSASRQGLFGFVGKGWGEGNIVTIQNLNLENVDVSGGTEVGGLVGRGDNIHIENVHVSGEVNGTTAVGGLIGYMIDATDTVLNSHSTVTVSGTEYVGGLVGYLRDSSITDSYATGSITGETSVGGLVGKLDSRSSISNSYATGSVSGTSQTGGLVGHVRNSNVSDSYATGEVVSTSGQAGGLIGLAEYTSDGYLLTRNHANGNVQGKTGTGGLIGALYGQDDVSSYASSLVTVSKSYARGVVDGGNDEAAGGLIGEVFGLKATIEDVYATGRVHNGTGSNFGGLIGYLNAQTTLQRAYAVGAVDVTGGGGLIGANADATKANVTQSYWNTETSGKTTSAGGAGKTTTQLYDKTTFTGWSAPTWSFFEGGAAAVAGYELGEGLPYLTGVTRVQDRDGQVTTLFAGGWGGLTDSEQTGADGSAYTISNWNQLQNINRVAGLGFDFELANNLNTTSTGYAEQAASTANSGAGWKPIGKLRPLYNEQEVSTNDDGVTTVRNRWRTTGSDTPFFGTFDGKNFSIAGLNINLPVAYPENPAANQIFDSNGVGLFGFVSGSSSEVRNLTLVNPSVKGSSNVGSVVGAIVDGSIRNITVQNAQVEGLYSVGGIAGALLYDDSTPVAVNLQVSSGHVTGLSDVGGAVGSSEGNISLSNAAVTVTGSGSTVGGLVGDNYGVIDQSSASGSVTGGSSLGGLAGSNDGTISSSFASGDVTNAGRGTSNGGLVGSSDGIITDSYATGDVVTPATGFTGGLVGSMFGGQISRSYATGSVQATSLVGGLVGYSESFSRSTNNLIEKSYATGAVTASADHSGGLVGRAKNTNIQNSYAISSVSGTGFVGGLVGEFQGGSESDGPLITNSFAAGAVTGTSNVGGLVGRYSSLYPNEYSSTRNSYWDTTTTGQSTSQGGVGKTTAQMKDIALYSAWSIEDDQTLSDGYPRLTRSADDSAVVWKIKSVADTTSSSGGSSSNADGGGDSTGGSGSSGGSSSGGSSSGGDSSVGSSTDTGTGGNSTDSSSTGGSGTGNNGSTTDQTAGNGGGNNSGADSSTAPPRQPTNTTGEQQRQAAIQAAQSAVQAAAQQVSGSAAGASGVTGNPAISSSMSTQLGSGPSGSLASPSLSGGLAFVNVSQSQSGTETSTESSAQAPVKGSQALKDGAGRDVSGFMRVFVVNGGISLPPQINEAEHQ